MTDDPKWYHIEFSKTHYSWRTKFRFWSLIFLIPSFIILTTIHEFGHLLIALIFDWEVKEIHISFFPFILDLSDGYIIANIPSNATDIQLLIYASAGSSCSMIVGSIFLFLFYKYNFPSILEIFLFIYSIALVSELYLYIYIDLFIVQIGDWYFCFTKCPIWVGIFFLISIVFLYYWLKYEKRIFNKVDIDFEE